MQRDMPLPRIQPAYGWSGVERRNAFRLVSRGQARPFVVGCMGGCESPLLGWDATGGRSAALAKVSDARPHLWDRPARGAVLPRPTCCLPVYAYFPPLFTIRRWLSDRAQPIRFTKSATRKIPGESICRISVWHSAIASCHAKGSASRALRDFQTRKLAAIQDSVLTSDCAS